MSRIEPSAIVPAYFPIFAGSGVAIVGQSPGKDEVSSGEPFVGASGRLLQDCFKIAGIDWSKCLRTNVIPYRPPGNDFAEFYCAKKAEVGGAQYPYGPIAPGKYLKPEWLDELIRLRGELEAFKPNLVIACGAEALWALTGQSGITKWRNAVIESSLIPGLKVIPIFHPAAALRNYTLKADIARGLLKAEREMKFPEIRRVSRKVWIYPSVDDLWDWLAVELDILGITKQLETYGHAGAPLVSIDLETRPPKIIKCIGFSFRPECALVVPFWDPLREGNSYWRTEASEIEAWDFVHEMFYKYPVLGQNFVQYDTFYMLNTIGIVPRRFMADPMVLHSAFQPELSKGLGDLTGFYCDEAAYKNLRPRGKGTEKKDD